MVYITAPCIEACPSKINVPQYIDYIRDGKPEHSLGVILQKYPMAATCGRVCVRFCEMACRRNLVDEAVGIKTLKRYVADYQTRTDALSFSRDLIAEPLPPSMRIAVVGAGPAGVSCAYHLLLHGYHVDILEAMDQAGGMAAIGIPSYRLPKDVLKSEMDIITELGGRFLFNQSARPRLFDRRSVRARLSRGVSGAGLPRRHQTGRRRRRSRRCRAINPASAFCSRSTIMSQASARPKLCGTWSSSAAATWRWIACVPRCAWARARSTSSIAAAMSDMPADAEEIEAAERRRRRHPLPHQPDADPIRKMATSRGVEVVHMRQTEKSMPAAGAMSNRFPARNGSSPAPR